MVEKSLFDHISLDKKEYGLVTAALVSGIIHVYVGYSSLSIELTLAGLGFLGGIGLFLCEKRKNLIVAVSIPYTAAQVILYYQIYGLSFGPLGAIDKVTQVLFIALGIYYLRKNSQMLKFKNQV